MESERKGGWELIIKNNYANWNVNNEYMRIAHLICIFTFPIVILIALRRLKCMALCRRDASVVETRLSSRKLH